MLTTLILLPAAAAVLCFFIRQAPLRRALLVSAAACHAGLTLSFWFRPPDDAWRGALRLDAIGQPFLSILSGLFLVAAVYAVGYLRRESPGPREDFLEGFRFTNAPEAVFTGCLLFFLSTMTLVMLSENMGLLWIAVEATTLSSAPLIYFHRHHRSLEATWKYLLICSVGIGLALLGNFFLAVAASSSHGASTPLSIHLLCERAPELNAPWLKAAFIFLLVGYGTKMGLAPLHTWLPDAHSEAPSVVSALLSGALLNCAFVGILRIFQICAAAGLAPYAQGFFILFGLASIALAAAFLLAQRDYKRLLAYSSVEHMGILALGLGIGGTAAFGAMLHAVNHSFTKAMLFLLAGNILAAYRTKSVHEVRGVLRRIPVTGALWLAGLFAITGSPPFGTFVSELLILRGALEHGRFLLAALYLALLSVIFVGMAATMARMAHGEAPPAPAGAPDALEAKLSIGPPLALGLAVLLLGVYLPPSVDAVLRRAAEALGAG
ncbi:MAG TPA: proton-conducting transporter membrane subunit [Candidatus Eisenbacteria bacterium]